MCWDTALDKAFENVFCILAILRFQTKNRFCESSQRLIQPRLVRCDQAFVEQKNGAVVRRLMGYGRFEGADTARVMARLYAAARLYINFFQPSFKLKEKRREGAKVIKRYHAPSTPYERAMAHPEVSAAVKQRLREQYRTLDPVALLAEIRATQEELGNRVDRRADKDATLQLAPSAPDAVAFAKTLGMTVTAGDPRGTHRRPKRRYKTRVRMPSKLDPHVATIENWLAEEPQTDCDRHRAPIE